MKCKLCEWEKYYTKIYENEQIVAVWGAPYIKGHVTIILKRHIENLTELTIKEACAVMEAWIKVGKAIEKVIKPDIINWQINCNWIRHIHAHIYPRWKEDSDWGEPIQFPTREQVNKKKYVIKALSEEEKQRIIDLV